MKGALSALLLGALRLYRKFLSPLLPPACRFHPSCSVYAMEAVGRYGPAKGSWLAIKRLLRCHPFNPGGYDPVP
jgi:putative membrane protein insertion efficiency factor